MLRFRKLANIGGAVPRLLGLGAVAWLAVVGSAWAQPTNDNFASAEELTGLWAAVTSDTTDATAEAFEPSHAGFPAMGTVWYKWTAPQNGEVLLDTLSSPQGSDTVLAVYTGNTLSTLRQVAANDDVFPFTQYNISGSSSITQPFNGPSALRFNAKVGTTYYIVVGSKYLGGSFTLGLAYHSGGVFRFATEDAVSGFDPNTFEFTTTPVYQCSEWESYATEDASTWRTYYEFGVPGLLVTVTRLGGSSGRMLVDYATEDVVTPVGNDVPAVAGVDYFPVSGTLVFDDFEMTKRILVQIMPDFGIPQTNRDFAVVLSNARPDPLESADVSTPRIDGAYGSATVRILDADIDPVWRRNFQPDPTDTNDPPVAPPIFQPTNAVFNIARKAFRTVEDVNGYWTEAAIWIDRWGTNRDSIDVHYRINNFLGATDSSNPDEMDNNLFPLCPGSDYATPLPIDGTNGTTVIGIHGTNADFELEGVPDNNYSFPGGGTITFPGGNRFNESRPFTFRVFNDNLTEFNEDFHISLYANRHDIDGDLVGMVGTATVTILYDDQDPPAGSVDQFHNPDLGDNMVPSVITTPPNQAKPGADNAVYGLAVLPDNRTVIVGDFRSYNATPRNRIARLNLDGSLDTSFNPGSGANDSIRALAQMSNGQLVIGGRFTAFNGTPRIGVARLSSNGSLDANFNPGNGPNGLVQAVAVQSDGKVIIAGEFTSVNDVPRTHVARLQNDGSLDTTFDPGVNGPDGTVWAVALQSDGKVVIGGEFELIAGQAFGGIARLNADGTLDTTFNPGSGTDGTVYALAVQSDGNVLVGGDFTTMDANPRNNLARLNSDGSIDTSFDTASSGADGPVFAIVPSGSRIYIGGGFLAYNGTHRRGFARLFTDGTVDTSFLDTAYNQFAGLHRARFSDQRGMVYAAGVQTDGKVMIAGSFSQVGGGQADMAVRPDTADANLWVEPKARDGVRNRLNVARLIGGETPGPGNLSITADAHTANENQSSLSVLLNRENGSLGYLSANFEIEEGLAQSGVDYVYNAVPPIFLSSWELTYPANEPAATTRMHSDGLIGTNSIPTSIYGQAFYQYAPGELVITIPNDSITQGDRNTTFRLSNPTAADQFYLGGENIPLGGALGRAVAPLSVIDDDNRAGVLGFASINYVVNEGVGSAVVTVIRTNGSYGTVSCRYGTVVGGSATAGTDYRAQSGELIFVGGQTNRTFTVPITDDSTVEADETISLGLSMGLSYPNSNVTLGLTNAMITIVDNDTPGGKLNFSTATFGTNENAGAAVITVTRSGSSAGSLVVYAAATNGTAVAGVDFVAVTNVLSWTNGDVTSRTFPVPLIDDTTVEANKTVSLRLFNPTLNGIANAATLGTVASATLVITNDDLPGLLAFSTGAYNANENGGPAVITVVRTGGSSESATVNFAAVGGTAVPGFDFEPTSGTLSFGPGELSKSFVVPVFDNVFQDGTRFVTLLLSNGLPAGVLGSPATVLLNIVDDESVNEPPGALDTLFMPSGMNDAVDALALQPDGKILAGGDFTQVNLTPQVRLVRLFSTDGTVDDTFRASANGTVRAITPQVDGRIVVAGSFTAINGVTRNHISRLNTNGTLDTVFDPGSGTDGTVYGVAESFVGEERKIVLGGGFTVLNGVSRNGVGRLNNDGSVDSGFNPGLGLNGTVYAVAVYPTNTLNAGKVILGGDFTTVNGTPRARIARLNVDGSLDTTFDPGAGADAAVRAIALQADGRVLIGGAFTNFNGALLNRLARLKADGTVDTTFKPGEGANDVVSVIVVQGDTKIVLGGQFTRCNGVTRHRLTRLNNDGTVDPTINFGTGANSFVAASIVQPDGKIIIGGGFTEYDGTARKCIARIYGGSVAGTGTFEFTAATYQANENGTNATITVRRRGGTSAPTGGNDITVLAATSDGTATNGVNYLGGTNVLTFPPGEVLQSFLVPLIDDYEVDAGRAVNLTLVELLPAGEATLGNQPTAVLNIVNDDSAISFSAPVYTRNENSFNGLATITVVRTGSTQGAASVDFTTLTNGTATALVDFTPVTNTVTFAAGETTKNVFVPILNDNLIEGDETVTMELTNVIGALLFSPAQATLVVVDDDFAPGQIAFASLTNIVREDAGTAVISLIRTNGKTGSVSLDYFTTDVTAVAGVDFTGGTGKVVFGDGETNKSILVPITNDALVEGTEQFLVTLTNAAGGATIAGATVAQVMIEDDEIGFSFSSPAYIATENAGMATVTVLRAGGSNGVASVQYATTNGTASAGEDYTVTSGLLIFSRGETFKTFTVPILEDTLVEGDETFGVVLSNPSFGTQLLNARASVAIIDNDAGISLATNSYVVTEWSTNGITTNAVVEVLRTGDLNSTVSVTYGIISGTAIEGQDFTPVGGLLTFTNGEVRKTITIPITDDTQVEGTETFTFALSAPSGGAALTGLTETTITIVDNDASIHFSSPSYIVSEGGVQAVITVVRSNILDSVVSVKYTTDDGTATNGVNYLKAEGTLVFTNGETVKTFVVPLIDNTLVQGTLTVNLLLSGVIGQAYLITPSAAVLSIVDNDGGVIAGAGSKLTADPNGNGAIDPGETVTVLFALRDASIINTTNLVATLLSTNGIVTPSGARTYGVLEAGGASVSRSFTFTAVGTNGAIVTPTFRLQDGETSYGTVSFSYLLGTTTTSFTNGNAITIPDQGIASPYPSTISVTGIVGVVTKAVVTFTNLAHTSPDDIDMLLVSPAGQKAVLFSDVGGTIQITNITLTLDDAATNSLPNDGPITNGVFKPTDFLVDTFPSPAPPGPYGSTLAAFNGGNPIGDWQLFIADDAASDFGSIGNGWILDITTSGRIAADADLSLTLGDTPDPAVITSNITYTLTITNHGPWTATGILATNLLPANASLVSAAPSQGSVTTNGTEVRWTVGTLSMDAVATLTIVVRPTVAGSFTNTCTVAAVEADPNTGNNTRSASTLVNTPVADLALLVLDEPDPVMVGNNLTYTLVVTNYGPATATHLGVTNTLPAGVTFVSASPANAYVLAGNVVTFTNLGDLGSGQQASVTVTVKATAAGTLVDSAACGSLTADSRKGNNLASVKTIVFAPQLSVRIGTGGLTVSWPADVTGFALEQTASLTPPVVWSVVTNPPPALVDGQQTVTIPVGNGSAFFRLRATTP